ncbi:MAG: ribonucleotide reductase N-terminal alpha domain-containing protein [bacterium]|nr:ribonucleotide reductase N-terminal alpha domain-containing protein [bacterium]MDT8395990.1 ribonucleotide reductase N-terminal alpha domain-containing protein [bacterium]
MTVSKSESAGRGAVEGQENLNFGSSLASAELSENAKVVLAKRYLKRDGEGNLLEEPEDLFRRVAGNIAQAEKKFGGSDEKVARTADLYFNLMSSLSFMPNSPTLMNAGRELQQLSACFVLPVGDSMESIFDAVKHTAMIHKSGGGTGFSFSRLRPGRDVVRSTSGVSSGPISFMKVFNQATEVIKQGGTRRGANMGILRIDHPDILNFIRCKEENDQLNNFNISVGLTEEFMKAVADDEEYPLINPRTGEEAMHLRAREVFQLVVEKAHQNGEPGIIFLDRVNRDNPTPALGEMESTNPCVTGDSFVMTTDGPRQVRNLLGSGFEVIVNGQPFPTTGRGFFATGRKQVFRLTTKEGHHLRITGDHPVLQAVSVSRYSIAREWTPASSLEPGDRIVLHDHRRCSGWNGRFGRAEGYLLGLLVGDGTLKRDKAVISVWCPERVVNGDTLLPAGSAGVMAAALEAAATLPHRADFMGWQKISGREVYRMSLASVRSVALELGLKPGCKMITPELEKCSSLFYGGFLGGLFDADGSVQGNIEKGVSVRLAQSDLPLLEAVQRMLMRLGIVSVIYRERRPAGKTLFPDGRGSTAEYPTKAQHELVITRENVAIFEERVGFNDDVKRARLKALVSSFRRRMNRERFLATVDSVVPEGVEEVYDVQVPGVNAFDANGLYVHNCGEQPLLPYESCNLGSINLSRTLKYDGSRVSIDYDKLAQVVTHSVRFLDNVIEMNRYPLEQIEEMTRKNRKIGLGIMGWADLLFRLGIPYNSEEAVALAEKVMGFVHQKGVESSSQLAAERGPFPAHEGSVFDVPGRPPVRNATVTTIAPTGTISIIANTTSGIEPLFAIAFQRNVLDNQRLVEVHPYFKEVARREGFYSDELMDQIAREGSLQHIPGIPDWVKKVFVTSHDINPEWHIRMQAAFQKFTDNAVSKTVNFPHEATRNDIEEVYLLAYELGCKGVTVYRDGSRDEQVLSIGTRKGQAAAAAGDHGMIMPTPRPRPSLTQGMTIKMKTGCGNLYVTINEDEKGLCEVFTQMGKAGGCAASQSESVSRMVSLALRSGIEADAILKQLSGIRCPSPLWQNGEMVLSCSDAIAKALRQYVEIRRERGGEQPPKVVEFPAPGRKAGPAMDNMIASMGRLCPDCSGTLEFAEGCATCHSCGYSKCS